MSSDTHASQDYIYVPPPGLAFRILGYVSQQVIFSRTQLEPEVGQYPSSDDYPDHWFTLLHGTGEHAGLYAIKSRLTGKVLFSRQEEPRVGHIDGDGLNEDNWFTLEPGKGQYAKHFRLITPSQGMALVSRTDMEPYLYNHPASEIYPDHHFSFLFEDMKVDSIDYDLDHGRIISSTPLVLADQINSNSSSLVQEMSFALNKSMTNTSTYQYSNGFTISIGTEFSASVPIIADGKFSINASTTMQWTRGESTSYTTTLTYTFTVKASPGETVHAVSTVNQGRLDVPFTVHLSSKSTDVKVETKGMWSGISSWDLRHTTETVKTTI